ncbi:MAG TPA: hypothetical protein VNH53_10370 [Sphingomicrobium sp.]|nr:hypothetical protein [Sphingomicrobium sp.]
MLLLIALAGCDSPPSDQPANQANSTTEQAATAPQEAVPPLAGQWTVTEINGIRPAQVWPMAVDVTDELFTLTSECRRFAWGIRQEGHLVTFTRRAGRDCPRVRSPSEEVVEKPIDMANIAMFSDEGRDVLLSGPGGTLKMRRR